ncbi:MAG: phage holin family protein [Tepidiformaceae bacterium]
MAVQSPNGHVGVRDDLRDGREELRDLSSEVGEIAQDLRDLFKSELDLAKTEMSEQFRAAIKIVVYGAAAGVMALLCLVFLGLTAMFALNQVLAMWLSAVIVAGGLLLLAVIAGLAARRHTKQLTVVPRKTIQSVREDVSWAKAQAKSRTT